MGEKDDENNLLLECLKLQLTEIEMLTSMYPFPNEFNVTVPSVILDINNFIDRKTAVKPSELDFTLNLDVADVKEKVELIVCLPHKYPSLKPSIYTRSNGLNRVQQRDLNSELQNFLDSLTPGDLCTISLVGWLNDNAAEYFTTKPSTEESEIPVQTEKSTNVYSRIWLYSHHIYSKFKRKDILDLGGELKLTGFSLPGKPGYICAEGHKSDCDEFLQTVKQMSWKKLSLVKEETANSDETSFDDFRKFQDFQEISFQVRKGPAKEYHMDMGQFLEYLEAHRCGYAFQDLFGLEGRSSSKK